MKKFIPNETEMLAFGTLLAKHCCIPRTVIYLYGNLGAGKTTLVRGFLRGLGFTGKVKSPTYTIVEPYEINNNFIFHFDFYRVQNPKELEFIGIEDYFSEKSICLIEWPDQGGELLPGSDLSCYIEPKDSGREVKIIAETLRGENILKLIKNDI